MGKLRGMVLVLAIAGLFVSCAKDRTLKDYQDEEALNDLAQFQAVQGRYSGVITNDKNHLALGGLELVLQARLKTDSVTMPPTGTSGNTSGSAGNANGSGSNTAKAVLITELHFQDTQFFTRIFANSGYYDPQTGIYQADFTIQYTNGMVKTISLTGNIGDGHIRGSMQGVGSQAQSSSFDLQLNGRAIDDLSKLGKPIPGAVLEGARLTYPAKFRWSKDQPIQDVYLHAYYPVRSPLQHFVEVFSPESEKTLELDIMFSEDLDVMFSGAVWDSQSGEVVASDTITNPSTGAVTRQLRCAQFFFASTKRKFNCTFWTNRTSPVTIEFNPATP